MGGTTVEEDWDSKEEVEENVSLRWDTGSFS